LRLFEQKISLITIKRDLDYLTEIKYLERKGKGRATFYEKTNPGLLFLPLNASQSKSCSLK
jgi:DeoR/GlpR family transcriptional regulator of sugar metabolism